MIVLLLLVLITSIYVIYKTINSRGSPIEDITLKEEINYGTNFALMIEQDDGTYIESTSTKWPENYKLNLEKSKCIDTKGNELNNVLTENNGLVQVKTTKTSYCYLYFDKKENGSVILSETSGTIYVGSSKTFIVTSNLSGGTLSVTSGNTGIVSASINGTIVTLKGISEGIATITIKSSETDSYLETIVTYSISVEKPLTAAETLIENVSSDVLWKSTLEDDGYRYVGTDPANYVCFGYSDASENCDFTNATNTDLYAYRIIGIFEDSEGVQHLKLIKKEALNTKYAWTEDYGNDVDWASSDLYKGLNGISGEESSNLFMGISTYSYMQDSVWINKIETWKWTATNTQTYYIGSSISNVGVVYYYSWPIGLYNSEHEIDTTTGCYQASSVSAINCKTTASYTYPEAKIGLMYASDYALSLGETAVSMTGSTSTNRTTLKTGWMHISNNDSDSPNGTEWTISRHGNGDDYYYACGVYSNGTVNSHGVENYISVRPVFYLTSDIELTGSGTIDNPYIITN